MPLAAENEGFSISAPSSVHPLWQRFYCIRSVHLLLDLPRQDHKSSHEHLKHSEIFRWLKCLPERKISYVSYNRNASQYFMLLFIFIALNTKSYDTAPPAHWDTFTITSYATKTRFTTHCDDCDDDLLCTPTHSQTIFVADGISYLHCSNITMSLTTSTPVKAYVVLR